MAVVASYTPYSRRRMETGFFMIKQTIASICFKGMVKHYRFYSLLAMTSYIILAIVVVNSEQIISKRN